MARKILLRPKTQRRLLSLVDTGFVIIWVASVGALIYYFASMSVRGLFNISFVLFGAHVGYTSLLFNRARAYDDGPLKRRTLVAAEVGLRSTMLFIAVTILGAFSFTLLTNLGYVETPMNWSGSKLFANAATAPTLVAFFLVFFLQLSFLALHRSVVILVRRDFGFVVNRKVFVRQRKRTASL